MRDFNPDLPILDELGQEFERMATGVPAPAQPAPGTARVRRRRRGHGSRRTARVTRRAAVVLVLLCLVGGVAIAARFSGGDNGTPEHTAPALLGHAGGGAWHVSAYRDQGRLCLLLVARGASLTSECGSTPGVGGVRTTSLRASGSRLVAGITGPKVAAVTVRAGGTSVPAPTHVATDPGNATEAGVPSGSRWFVVSLPSTGAAPALVTPLDRDGKRLGSRYLDCSLGVVGAACEARIRAAASAAERGV